MQITVFIDMMIAMREARSVWKVDHAMVVAFCLQSINKGFVGNHWSDFDIDKILGRNKHDYENHPRYAKDTKC